MALTLGVLNVLLKADTTALMKGLAAAEKSVTRTMNAVKKASGDLSNVGLRAAAAVGAAVAVASKMDPRIARTVDTLKATFAALALEIGRMAIPALNSLSQAMTSVLGWVQHLNPHIKAMIPTFLTWGLGLTAAAFAVNKFITAAQGLLGLVSVFAKLGVSVGALAIEFAPLILAFGLVWAASAALRVALGDDFGELGKVAKGLWVDFKDGAKIAFNQVSKWVRSLVVYISDEFEDVRKNFFQKLTDQVDSLIRVLDALRSVGVKKIGGIDTDAFSKIIKGVVQAADQVTKKRNPILQFIEDVGEGAGNVAAKMKDDFKNAIDFIEKLFAKMSKGGPGVTFDPKAEIPTSYMLDAMKKEGRLWKAGAQLPSSDLLTTQTMGRTVSTHVDTTAELPGTYGEVGKRINSGGQTSSGLGAYQNAAKQNDEWLQNSMAAVDGLLSRFVGKMGKVGDVISAAGEGFKAGGPWGALLAVLADLFLDSENMQSVIQLVDNGFKRISNVLGKLAAPMVKASAAANDVLTVFLDILGPVFDALTGAFENSVPLFEGLAGILKGLKPILDFFMSVLGAVIKALNFLVGGVLQLFFYAVRGLAQAFGWAAVGIAKAWNWFVEAVQNLLRALGDVPFLGAMKDWADDLESIQANVGPLIDSLNELNNMTWDSAAAKAAESAQVQLATDALSQFSEELLNAPTGFKAGAFRFNATDVGGSSMGGSPVDFNPSFGSSDGGTTVIVNVSGSVVGVDDLADRIQAAKERANRHRGGSSVGDL